MNNSSISWMVYLAVIVISGAVGGFISVVSESLRISLESLKNTGNDEYKTSQKVRAYRDPWLLVGGSLVGVAGAFAVIFMITWVARFSYSNTPNDIVLLTSLCIMGGFFSQRYMPLVGRRFEEELFRRRLESSEIEVEKAKSKSEEASDLANALSEASTALDTKSPADLRRAVQTMEAEGAKFPEHRIFHIYWGRLYRNLARYDDAVHVLRRFIYDIKANPITGNSGPTIRDAADASYNVACYLSLKAKSVVEQQGQQTYVDQLRGEAIIALQEAITGNPENMDLAKGDSDLDFIREQCAFLEGGEKEENGSEGDGG